jgi:antitoxin Phd
MIKVTSVEAQNSFGKLLDTAQRDPVVITRHGRPAAFIVSPQDMAELMDARRRRGKALKDLEAFFERADKSASAAARKLTEQDIARMVRDSR